MLVFFHNSQCFIGARQHSWCSLSHKKDLEAQPSRLTSNNPSNTMAGVAAFTTFVKDTMGSLNLLAKPELIGIPSGEVAYFDELEGYFYIKSIGSGADGQAHLVRSRVTGALSVRKEDRYTVNVHHQGSKSTVTDVLPQFDRANNGRVVTREATSPTYEVDVAQRLQHIPGVIKLEGSVLHYGHSASDQFVRKDNLGRGADQGLQISYWKYYNLGTINDVVKRIGHFIPEYWLCRFLSSMLKTMAEVHKDRIVHVDAHAGNWFVHYSDGKPSIHLGDFGRAAKANNVEDVYGFDAFDDLKAYDYLYLIDIAAMFLKIDEKYIEFLDTRKCGTKELPYSRSFIIDVMRMRAAFEERASTPEVTPDQQKNHCIAIDMFRSRFEQNANSIARKKGIPAWTLLPENIDVQNVPLAEVVDANNSLALKGSCHINYLKGATIFDNEGVKTLKPYEISQGDAQFPLFRSKGSIDIDYKPETDLPVPQYNLKPR